MARNKLPGLLLLMLLMGQTTEGEPQKHALLVGETKTISLPEGEEVKVSQKGVVDLHSLAPDKWQITGLKKGVVLLQVLPPADGKGRVLIEVQAPKLSEEVKESPFRDPVWRSFLCDQKGVFCDGTSLALKGETDSYLWLQRARELCEPEGRCLVEVELTETGIRRLRKAWQRALRPWFRVQIFATGKGVAWAACEKKDLEDWKALADHLSGGMVKRESLKVLCEDQFGSQNVVVKAKAFFLKQDEADSLGVKWDSQFPLQMLRDGGPFNPEIQAFLNRHKSRVIGEPVLRLRSGEEAEVHSGSEIRYVAGPESEEDWKRLGFALKIKALAFRGKSVLLRYKMQLSQPMGAESVQSSLLTAQIEMPLGQPRLVGELDLEADGETNAALQPFNHIPIVAPFFRWLQKAEARSRLYLMFVVIKDDLRALRPELPRLKEP